MPLNEINLGATPFGGLTHTTVAYDGIEHRFHVLERRDAEEGPGLWDDITAPFQHADQAYAFARGVELGRATAPGGGGEPPVGEEETV